MKTKILFFIASLFLFVSMLNISAASLQETVCCERTITGAWCQDTQESQCDASYSLHGSSCAQSMFCRRGTCVNENQGICTENVGKEQCEKAVSLGGNGGVWYSEGISEIPLCKLGCCKLGDEVAFVSQTECKQISSDYGINVNFLDSITDENSCLALSNSKEKGACTYKGESVGCEMLTKEDCLSNSGTFHKGLLCTASLLGTDCAPSSKTQCLGEDVYFLDTCGNLANKYDTSFDPSTSSQEISGENQKYWTYLYSDTDYSKLQTKLSGDCDVNSGTKCVLEKGVNYCGSITCEVVLGGETVTKQHGESWCAETPGTMPHILVNPVTMEWEDERQLEELIKNYETYNIPGSRYAREYCWYGEVMIEPCEDYRNEVCKEAELGDSGESYTIAQCRANTWRQCLDITSKEECLDPFLDCTWVPGYRFDLTKVSGELKDESQGSCVPLFAPGFDFWSEESDGADICSLGSIQEVVLYETSLGEDRDELGNNSELTTENCYANCYAIPGYGSDINSETLKKIHLGEIGFDSSSKTISNREGYYCTGETGAVNVFDLDFSSKIDCVSIEDQPVYYTNEQWLTNITKRAALLGDCGYKKSVSLEMGQTSSEIITSIIQKLTQKGEVKENITNLRTIYIGEGWDYTKEPRINNQK